MVCYFSRPLQPFFRLVLCGVVAFLGLYGVPTADTRRARRLCFFGIDAAYCLLHYHQQHEGNLEVLCSASAEERTTICEAPLYLRQDVNHGTLWQVRDFLQCYFVTGPSGCSNKGVFEVSSASRRGICQDGTWELVNPNTITSDELYGVRVRRCFFIVGASCWSVLERMSDLCLDEGAP